tara:strand:+ start:125 stop:247 length:123 start_codon:yes stop_codon:yes gene_type:complete
LAVVEQCNLTLGLQQVLQEILQYFHRLHLLVVVLEQEAQV